MPELIAALQSLAAMEPVERARIITGLGKATPGVLARERAAAMDEATSGPCAISRAELARRLGISRSKVTEAIAEYAPSGAGG